MANGLIPIVKLTPEEIKAGEVAAARVLAEAATRGLTQAVRNEARTAQLQHLQHEHVVGLKK